MKVSLKITHEKVIKSKKELFDKERKTRQSKHVLIVDINAR